MSDPFDAPPPPEPGPEPPPASPADLFVRPERFFQALAARPRWLLPPFAIVVAVPLVSAIGGGLLIASGHAGAAGRQLQELLGQVDVSSPAFAVGASLGAVLGGLVSWLIAWAPLRLTTGSHPRLWELAGFAQVPFLVAAPLQVLLIFLASGPPGIGGVFLSAAAAAASCVLVHAGLRVLAPAAATSGTVAYALVQLLSVGLGLVGGLPGGGGGSGTTVM